MSSIGPAAGEIIEAGIGVPALVAGAHEKRRAANRTADLAGVDQGARGLMRAAEERVGRRAEPHALRLGRRDEFARLGDRDAERLLRIDMLARRDRLQADFDMGDWNGEVENDLDLRIGERRRDRCARSVRIPRRALRRPRVRASESATMSRIGNFFAAVR